MSRIYMYPKTSCECIDYKDASLKNKPGIPNNLGLNNCQVFDGLPRRDITDYKQSFTNANQKGLTLLNPQVYTDKYAQDYMLTADKKFVNIDARLYYAPYDQRLELDNAPIIGSVPLKDVYSEKLRGYGKSYKNYADIKEGQIMYYQDKSIEGPYFAPNFSIPSVNKTVMYRDPMGGVSAEYPRMMGYQNPLQSGCQKDEYGLTFLRDTHLHREDIMTAQMAKMNRGRYENRYPSN
jgi:hypothetical protein